MAGTRCPRCSAAVRPGAPWCTQCYTPVGAPAQRAAPEQQPTASCAVRVVEPPAAPPTTRTWPCGACGQANDLVLTACGGCGTPFLAGARDARPTLVLPGVGDLLALTPVRRVGLAVGAVVAFVLITSLLALLLA